MRNSALKAARHRMPPQNESGSQRGHSRRHSAGVRRLPPPHNQPLACNACKHQQPTHVRSSRRYAASRGHRATNSARITSDRLLPRLRASRSSARISHTGSRIEIIVHRPLFFLVFDENDFGMAARRANERALVVARLAWLNVDSAGRGAALTAIWIIDDCR
jgi:hypothetical protein